jgi:predicted tellurium resistance membrane protein TerC
LMDMWRKEIGAATKSFQNVLLQIIMIDLVFSFSAGVGGKTGGRCFIH